MASFRDFLLRFRPTGAPGRPASAGVPADRAAELRGELAPVLALLDVPAAEADTVRREAARQAEEIRRTGRAEAERLLDIARDGAQVSRDAVEAAARARAAEEAAALVAAVERDVEAMLTRGRTRLPALADTIVARALALAADGATGHRPPTGEVTS